MDFGLAFSYVFKDRDWLAKILIPGVVVLIPVLGLFVVIGWALEIQRRVMRADPEPLPQLRFGKHLADGFFVAVINVVYGMPLWIAYLLIIILGQGSWAMPTPALGVASSSSPSPLAVVLALFLMGLGLLYSIFMSYILPAAYGRFALSGRLGAAFQFGEVWRTVRATPVAFLLALVGMWIGGLMGGLGTVAFLIGVIFTLPYSQAFVYHLYGQAMREAYQVPAEPTIAE